MIDEKIIKSDSSRQDTLLAIDDVSLTFKKNVGIYLSKPNVRPEPVLFPSPMESNAPDNQAAYFYGTVLFDEGKFRMWYYAGHRGKNPDWPPRMMQQVAKQPEWFSGGECNNYQGPLCYAESDDGITWTKPALGQVLFKGSNENNALALPHTSVSGATVIKDMDDSDPARRYKMIYQFFPDRSDPVIDEYGNITTVALAVSPDGLNWTVTGMPFLNQFVEHSSFIKHNDYYILHYHAVGTKAFYCAEGGTPCGRTGVARVSPDFRFWPDLIAKSFALPEPEDRNLRGQSGLYDQVHLGVGATSFGNVCVGLYGLWHNADFDKAFEKISGDFGLLVSNDGIHFREPVEGHRFLRREDSLATPVPGHNFNTVLTQANGILNVGDETRIYHGRWRNAGGHVEDDKYSSGEIALATLPRDRWGALRLNPGSNEGIVCSAPIILPDTVKCIVVNGDIVAGLKVDILDEQFNPIPGFTNGRINGEDGLDCGVEWQGHTLADLAGQTVRLQINLCLLEDKSPGLYAVYIRK